MIKKFTGKGSKEKSSNTTTQPKPNTAARLADYTGAQSSPLAGYGVTTVPGIFHVQAMSSSPGSPAEEGAVGGYTPADPVASAGAAMEELTVQPKESKVIRCCLCTQF